jgi:hypothetical protein
MDLPNIDPLIGIGVAASTAITDAVYVFFNAAVSERRRVAAASWSSIWYLLSAFAVISYTSNWAYVSLCGGRCLDWRLSVDNSAESPRACAQIIEIRRKKTPLARRQETRMSRAQSRRTV